jgi:outer membrane immunogenic protein
MMLYATGGGAWASEEFSGQVAAGNFFTSTIATSQNKFSSGWVAGGGIEFMATANWLLRLEYLHYQFNSGNSTTVACTACVGFPPAILAGSGTYTWGNSSLDVLRGGLSYKF